MSETKKKIALPVLNMSVVNYVNALEGLGLEPVVIHEVCGADDFDALLLPGGGDIVPARYGEETLPECGPVDAELDDLQFAVLDAFVKAGKPVMGICRGHQVINTYFDGTLYQHIDAAAHHARDKEFLSMPGNTYDKVHASTAVSGSIIEELYGPNPVINSSHHQAVKTPGRGMKVIQTSDDGYVEGMIHTELPILSVQWHPERMSFALRREDTVDGAKILSWLLK